MPIKNEVAHGVYAMLEALTVLKDRKELTAPIDGAADRFNALLSRAQEGFPDAPLVQRVDPLRPHDRLIVLVARLAVLKSALDGELIRLNQGYMLNQAFRYWRHSSGKYYAVEFRRGTLWAVCGPVPFDDVDPRMLPHLPYEMGELRQWIDRHRREFTVYLAS